MTKRTLSVAILVCAGMCLAAWAQEKNVRVPKREREKPLIDDTNQPKPTPKAKEARAEPGPEEKALRAEGASLIADYNAKKAEAFAGHFTSDAEYELGSGVVLAGRDKIQEHFAQVFEQHPKAQVESRNGRVRLLNPHAAIVEGVASLKAPEVLTGKAANAGTEGTAVLDGGEAEVRHVSIWTLQDGKWLISSLREVTGPPVVTPQQRLQSLEWLVGDWVDESPESLIRTSCRWNKGKSFLLEEFTVYVQGREVLTGSQRIGWDPLQRQIHSWTFDSEGGHGEGIWHWDGEKWVIHHDMVHPDGRVTNAVHTVAPISRDSYRFEATHRHVAGAALPDLKVRVVRQAPPPASAAKAGK
jgi:uncharacterized protein (TIGR02246 family)